MDSCNYNPWNLKADISYFIVPRLKCFIEKVRAGEMVAIPDWVQTEDTVSGNDELIEKWLEILNDMLLPFLYNVEPNFFNELSTIELEIRIERGLKLFAKYFNHLWD